MSLPLIARDLYRRQQAVDRLERELADSPPAKRDAIHWKLTRAKAERDQMRKILDGHLDR